MAVGKLFAAGLETYAGLDEQTRTAIEHTNALRLFPRLGSAPRPAPLSSINHLKRAASRVVMRGVTKLISTA